MATFELIIDTLEQWIWNTPEALPFMVVLLLAYGLFITLRLGFIQIRRLGHGIKVVTGHYDDADDEGDINHFQALSTALSATVGIGNIAGVALAIHYGGPGALFWMWITAMLGMAIKYSEVTLAQHFRKVHPDGSVSGGPMYYIEKGLGPNWRWLAFAFAIAAAICAFLTGNAVQSNTVADVMQSDFEIPKLITGLVTSGIVAAVILGGIRRIGYVTARLVPFMATIYISGGLLILLLNADQILPSFGLILSQAFDPQAGLLGTGSGALIFTLSYGVQRGLFSNEAGQGSAPIAHSAARTDQPVREGVVALLEPLIDTLIVCTITGLVIVSTGAWDQYHPTNLDLADATLGWQIDEGSTLQIEDGIPVNGELLRYEIPVDTLFQNRSAGIPFTGQILTDGSRPVAIAADGTRLERLETGIVENGAPLTGRAFEDGLSPLFPGGRFLVTIAVILFAISTSISWSYYGDRAAEFLFGPGSVFWYRLAFVGMHLFGAVVTLTTIWKFGDVMLGLMAFFNIIALFRLTPVVLRLTTDYFRDPDA
ncbi:MAG: sodium:alanine symporter family protein [Balneolaceae bacterium]